MFTGRAGRPNIVTGGRGEVSREDWEGGSGSEAEIYKELDEEGGLQGFSGEEAGQETPSVGSGQLNHILESKSVLLFSVALL